MENNQHQNIIESFDFKAFASRSIKYWYLFVISLAIGGSISLYKIRYSEPSYTTYSKILLKDDKTSYWGQDYFMKGMELVNQNSELENEIGLINSFSLNKKTLELLDINIFYFDYGKIKTTELYHHNLRDLKQEYSFLR